MHGNTPYAGRPGEGETTSAQRRAVRRDLAAVTASTRSLLTDEFVVGGEVTDGADGLGATIAVRPPAGQVVSVRLDPDDLKNELAPELAAGAAFQVLRSDAAPDHAS
ncbi:hypothetical protein DP107_03780 [Haloglomus irregulare]|uniref:Uncharacterized protein n=1 Tax=Haloglomus irregulare TaxID=2234134 RepID=A0A554NC90_9EURY|nr:DUF5811 family protein [Haloglomus irregulare]TSD14992.1 hypothetical protein DP107_03780 [Haloglomus irregulare]